MTEIIALEGDADGLAFVRWQEHSTETQERKAIRRVFLFAGDDPNTAWLADCGVQLDEKGFILTGAAVVAQLRMHLRAIEAGQQGT